MRNTYKHRISFGGSISLAHSLDCVFMRRNVKDGDSWDFTDPSFQVFIAGSNDIASVLNNNLCYLFDSVDDAVISVGA